MSWQRHAAARRQLALTQIEVLVLHGRSCVGPRTGSPALCAHRVLLRILFAVGGGLRLALAALRRARREQRVVVQPGQVGGRRSIGAAACPCALRT